MSYHRQLHNEWIDRLAAEARILGESRMIRDDQAVTPELTDAVIRRYRELTARTGLSDGKAASSMGISSSTLSQVLSGSYPGDAEAMIRKLDKWMEQRILRENAPRPAGFVQTSVAKKIVGFTKRLCRVRCIGVVTGPSGCGKSMTADYLRSEIAGSILIRITTAGCTKMGVMDQIAQQLRLTGLKLTAYQIEQQIVGLLRSGDPESRRLIIVDEAHKLIIRRRDEGLHALRDLHDQTDCPLLLIGTSNLAAYLRDGRSGFEALDQISGRTGLWLNLGDSASSGDAGGPILQSVEDIRAVLAGQSVRIVRDGGKPDAAAQMTVSEDAVLYLAEQANEPFNGGLRTVKFLMLLAIDQWKNERVVSARMLDDLNTSRIGRSEATAMARRIMLSREQRRVAAAG